MATPEVIQSTVSFDKILMAIGSERITQNIDAFNAANGGGIVLQNATTQGSLSLGKFVKNIVAEATYRRDITSSSTRTAVSYEEGKEVKVKVGGGFGPIEIPDSVLAWNGEGEASAEVATAMNNLMDQYAESIMLDQLNTCLRAGVAAAQLSYQVALVTDTISQTGINSARRKMGDKYQSLTTAVMHSQAYFDLDDEAIKNENELFKIGDLIVNEATIYGRGMRIVVTDSEVLNTELVASSGDFYNLVLFLQNGGISCTLAKSSMAIEKQKTGRDNIYSVMQGTFDYKVGVMGVNYTGDSSPTDAEIATSANWSQSATDTKNTAGVLGIFGGVEA